MADGHYVPYPPLTLELGWQETLDAVYVRRFTALASAVVAVLQDVSPSSLARVRVAVAAPPVVNVSCPDVKRLLSFCAALPLPCR